MVGRQTRHGTPRLSYWYISKLHGYHPYFNVSLSLLEGGRSGGHQKPGLVLASEAGDGEKSGDGLFTRCKPGRGLDDNVVDGKSVGTRGHRIGGKSGKRRGEGPL